MILGSSLVVSGWDSARSMGSIFGGGTKIPHAATNQKLANQLSAAKSIDKIKFKKREKDEIKLTYQITQPVSSKAVFFTLHLFDSKSILFKGHLFLPLGEAKWSKVTF